MAGLQHLSDSSLTGLEQMVRQSVQAMELGKSTALLERYMKELSRQVAAVSEDGELQLLEQSGRELLHWVAKMATVSRTLAATELAELNSLAPYQSPERAYTSWQIQG